MMFTHGRLRAAVARRALSLTQACPPNPAPPPAVVASDPARISAPASAAAARATIDVARGATLRKFDKRLLVGSNIAIWHQASTFQNPSVVQAFQAAGIGLLRMPG